MVTEETVRQVATFIVLQHRLEAPRIAAEILEALDDESDLRQDWLQITRRVWRTLHRRALVAHCRWSAPG